MYKPIYIIHPRCNTARQLIVNNEENMEQKDSQAFIVTSRNYCQFVFTLFENITFHWLIQLQNTNLRRIVEQRGIFGHCVNNRVLFKTYVEFWFIVGSRYAEHNLRSPITAGNVLSSQHKDGLYTGPGREIYCIKTRSSNLQQPTQKTECHVLPCIAKSVFVKTGSSTRMHICYFERISMDHSKLNNRLVARRFTTNSVTRHIPWVLQDSQRNYITGQRFMWSQQGSVCNIEQGNILCMQDLWKSIQANKFGENVEFNQFRASRWRPTHSR